MPDLVKAVRPLAQMIANKQIEADAVISLAQQIIKHGRDRNGNATRTFATEEQVKAGAKPLMAVMGTREVSENKDDFYQNFREPQKIAQLVKENLKTKDTLFAALLPDEILAKHGFKKEPIAALRKAAYKDDALYYYVAANVTHLADKGEEHLKELKIGDKTVEVIMSLAEKVKSGDMEALKVAVDGENKAVVFDAVRRAGLLEQAKGDNAYWAGRARPEELSRVRKDMEAAGKHRREAGAEGDAAESRNGAGGDRESQGKPGRDRGDNEPEDMAADNSWRDRAGSRGKGDRERDTLKESYAASHGKDDEGYAALHKTDPSAQLREKSRRDSPEGELTL